MIKNASPGEFIFFEGREHRGGKIATPKVHSLVVKEGNEPYPYDSIIFERNLNVFGRTSNPIWAESELANHEVAYMLNNSKGKTFG